jgi:hypothetical protein
MAKGRKTKRAGRGKTKTPKDSKAPKAQKRSKYSRKKRKISRKRSLKGGMFPRLVRTLPDGRVLVRTLPDGRMVDELPVRPGYGTTWLYKYNEDRPDEPAIVIDPDPIIPTPPPTTKMLSHTQVKELKKKYDKSGRSADQRRAAEAKAIQEQRLREAAEAEEVNKAVNNLIEAIERADRSPWAAEELYDWDHSSTPPLYPWLA